MLCGKHAGGTQRVRGGETDGRTLRANIQRLGRAGASVKGVLCEYYCVRAATVDSAGCAVARAEAGDSPRTSTRAVPVQSLQQTIRCAGVIPQQTLRGHGTQNAECGRGFTVHRRKVSRVREFIKVKGPFINSLISGKNKHDTTVVGGRKFYHYLS